GFREAADPFLAVVVEAGGGHPVGAIDPPGHVLAPAGSHPEGEAQVGALRRGPERALRPVRDVRHPVLPGRGRAVDEEVGGEPAEVDVAIGRDHLVAHTRCLLRTYRMSGRTNPTRSAGALPAPRGI